MKIGQLMGSYLRHDDLDGKQVTVVIHSLTVEKVGDDEKPVIYFEGKKKGLALNKTNAETICDIAGTDETDAWPGTKITLFPDKTKFGGRTVDCIRIKAPDGWKPPKPDAAVIPTADDEIPF